MDFFEAQDRARRNTWRLIALFSAAVVVLIIMANLLVGIVVVSGRDYVSATTGNYQELLRATPTEVWIWVTLGVGAVVAGAIAFKWISLSGGGRSVAESLGGQLLHQSTSDFRHRRLLNVVEEMAIASGIPVPPVYVIDEPSINAFAAGFSHDDAVIGVNQGTIDYLSREELQGVIGHEFSHILNNDINLNLKLIAVLHGILFLGMAGYAILRTGGRSRRDGAPLALLGLGLVAIGYGGTFFGNMIKSGVSRQREYLADGASVQFTRNPGGLARALKKIGGLSFGSSMRAPAAAEASHMFFGLPKRTLLDSLMSTHPPLPDRILALEPTWDGTYPVTDAAPVAPTSTGEHVSALAAATPPPLVPGEPQLKAARALIDSAPDEDLNAATDPWSARALIYALLLNRQEDARQTQMQWLQIHADTGISSETERLFTTLDGANEVHRLLLVKLCIPTLKEMSPAQFRQFLSNCVELIKTDRQIDLLEWAAHRVMLKELTPHFEGPKRIRSRYRSTDSLASECAELLSALAREAAGAASDATDAYLAGAQKLNLQRAFVTAPDRNFARLNDALRTLRKLAPLAKPRLIKAAAATVFQDGHATPRQEALMHGIAATLDCPLPPSTAEIR
ncbi:MAG: M48 family metallopeptidase [Pseudomonadales bacterium]|jgi:Zn-dependent protease with chaperone function|nr:M48 family metallopeptidase [Pseudomonadales bacterium]MDP6470070.1 M48 family metallopeptidase [Pseudomonadales bacterium]MDP6826973.1 M48 family metallopeptidase [Pseudomonadales bacterium]MDP6971068.1 M48 family metallopeptidase [Pseudomonadales bacterium]